MADNNLSSVFAALVKELQKKPDDPALKQRVFNLLPEMKELARKNPMDLFRLAQIYSPSSPQYKNMIRQAATGGCTNAMFAMAELLVKTGSATDLATAAHYVKMIERSSDSFMIKHSKQLMSAYPALAAELRGTVKSDPYNSKIRFFSNQPDNREERQEEQEFLPQSAI